MNMNKALKDLKEVCETHMGRTIYILQEDKFEIIEKELKALEIIKDKKVDMHLLLETLSYPKNGLKAYNQWLSTSYRLTQEEYELFKEVRIMKTLHLLVTTLCARNCKYCCNKQYDLNELQYVSEEDIKQCDAICITGGEPVLYCNVSEIAAYYKNKYANIKNVYVYANALELEYFLLRRGNLDFIDGLSVSIKNQKDLEAFKDIVEYCDLFFLKSNRIYVFDNLLSRSDIPKDWVFIERKWQEDFKPADNCLFRKI